MAENKDKNPSLENPLVSDETVFESPEGLPAWALGLESSDDEFDYDSLPGSESSESSESSELVPVIASAVGVFYDRETKETQNVDAYSINQEDTQASENTLEDHSLESSSLEAPMEEPEFLQEQSLEEQNADLLLKEEKTDITTRLEKESKNLEEESSFLEAPVEEPEFLQEQSLEGQNADLLLKEEKTDVTIKLEEESKNLEEESSFLEAPTEEPEFFQQSSFVKSVSEPQNLNLNSFSTGKNQIYQEENLLAEIASFGSSPVETNLDGQEKTFTEEVSPEQASPNKVIEFDLNRISKTTTEIGQLESVIANIDKDVSYLDFDIIAKSSLTKSNLEVNRYLSFFLGGTNYAIAANNVLEMNKVPKITFVPNVTEWVAGVTNLRGDILAVIDMRSFLGLAVLERRSKNRLLVIRNNSSTLTTGIIIDEVKGLREIPISKIKNLPDFYLEEKLKSFFKGVYNSEEGMLVLLDIELFLASPDLKQFELI